ncbi:MAG: hypothetical protein IT368_15400 [Candidatus Hydrogenedentes bacterium]|nr:hypothetical protein [Candidatus Hydrogenedentota bacterium]
MKKHLLFTLFLALGLFAQQPAAPPSVPAPKPPTHPKPAAAAKPDTTRRALNDLLDSVARSDQQLEDDAANELIDDGVRRFLVERSLATGLARDVDNTILRRRLDRQVAGEAASGGSTSLLALPGAPDLLSAALESGILSQSTEASVATFRLNTSKLFGSLYPQPTCQPLLPGCQQTVAQRLKGLSIAVAVDQAQEQTENVTGEVVAEDGGAGSGTGNTEVSAPVSRKRTLRGVTVKYELRRRKSFSDAAKASKWDGLRKQLSDEASKLALSANQELALLHADPEFLRRKPEILARLKTIAAGQGTPEEKLNAMSEAYHREMHTLAAAISPALLESSAKFTAALGQFRAQRNEILDEALREVSASFEYVYQRPAMQAEYSTLRFALSKPFAMPAGSGDALGQLTLNLGSSFYHSPPSGLSSFRDFRGGLQLDRKLPWKVKGETAVFSLAGYAQYQAEKGVLEFDANEITPIGGIPIPKPAKVLLDNKGAIYIAQAKLTIPLGKEGASFPIAVSWANRTELIKANETKFQFGFTFDLDKLVNLGTSK